MGGVRGRRRERQPKRTDPDPEAERSGPALRLVGGEFYPDWESIYRDNVDRIYRLMFAKVGNRPDAEDLTAEVFTAALRPLRVTASVGEVRAYLTATARTVLAGHWRRTLGREITVITDAEAAPERVEVDARPTAARVERLLTGLPEQYRQVLRLRFLEGCSVRETAAALGVSVANAKVIQHRALRRAAIAMEGVDQ